MSRCNKRYILQQNKFCGEEYTQFDMCAQESAEFCCAGMKLN